MNLLIALFAVALPLSPTAANPAVCPAGETKVEFQDGVRAVEWPQDATITRACIKAGLDQFWFDRPEPIVVPVKHDISHVVFYQGEPDADPRPQPSESRDPDQDVGGGPGESVSTRVHGRSSSPGGIPVSRLPRTGSGTAVLALLGGVLLVIGVELRRRAR